MKENKNRTVKTNKVTGEIRFSAYLPHDVHAALAKSAKEHRRSMNDEGTIILQEKFFLNSEKQLETRIALLEGRVATLEKSIKHN
ncbi:MAG: Arc family DNA-binding protein [Spirochaetaceae bacterium]|jgi:plasmid stability protein|nr:Arc family DNA-binding protein [Spirochaetaceae bacterium]